MAHAIHPRGTRFWRYPGINPRRVVATLLGGVWHRWLAGNNLVSEAGYACHLTQDELRTLDAWRNQRTGHYHPPLPRHPPSRHD